MTLRKDRSRDLKDVLDIVCETSQSEDGKLALDAVKHWFCQTLAYRSHRFGDRNLRRGRGEGFCKSFQIDSLRWV
ncbi:hypothetical protein NPIL_638571 [Nephila pilipes]|uniref:Uncharacterized protein n=1 Tax=Nephila pilipes TaxID=299642 RepID=A0A8X6PKN8_NEPPI|nr:hypothetical protein NPIL_638571 [Nephila pilipes]